MAANAMAAQGKISPAQRAINFARNTRLWRQEYPAYTKAGGEKVRFDVDKVNFLAKIRYLVECVLTVTHAANTTYTLKDHAPYTLLENIKIGANLAYTPWDTSGLGAYMLMLFRQNADYIKPVETAATPANADKRRWARQGNVASSGGTANKISFMIDLPVSVNDRDPIGLIMAQNQQTQIFNEIKLATADALYASGLSGYTFSLGDITVTPIVETFTIPPMEEAIPDLTVIKQVQEQNETTTAGKYSFRLPVGPTYRRVVFQLTDSSGNPVDDEVLTGAVELRLNTSDTPISISGKVMQRLYQEMTGGAILPRGMWGLDFTYQGLINYGGARDYLDTERMTEVWITVRHASALNMKVVYEALERMGG